MKQLGVFLLPVDGMLVQRRVTPSSNVACSHLFSWVERGTGRVKCLLSQEHNTVFRVRARTRTARSRDEGTTHRATVLTVFNFESIQNYVSHSKSICFVSCKRTTLNHLSIWMVCQLYKKLRFFINSHKLQMPSFSNMVPKALDSANRKLQCVKQQYLACVVGGIRERPIFWNPRKAR